MWHRSMARSGRTEAICRRREQSTPSTDAISQRTPSSQANLTYVFGNSFVRQQHELLDDFVRIGNCVRKHVLVNRWANTCNLCGRKGRVRNHIKQGQRHTYRWVSRAIEPEHALDLVQLQCTVLNPDTQPNDPCITQHNEPCIAHTTTTPWDARPLTWRHGEPCRWSAACECTTQQSSLCAAPRGTCGRNENQHSSGLRPHQHRLGRATGRTHLLGAQKSSAEAQVCNAKPITDVSKQPHVKEHKPIDTHQAQ